MGDTGSPTRDGSKSMSATTLEHTIKRGTIDVVFTPVDTIWYEIESFQTVYGGWDEVRGYEAFRYDAELGTVTRVACDESLKWVRRCIRRDMIAQWLV